MSANIATPDSGLGAGSSPSPLFAVGDLIEAENILWEVIKPKPADEPAPGVTIAENCFMLNGEVLAYAVRGYRAGGYHEVTPGDITRGWHSANAPHQATASE